MYKLVFLDVDGTLVDDNKIISEENIKVINECNKLGVKFIIASGRSFIGSKKIFDELRLDNNNTCLVIFNGAQIYDLSNNKLIHQELMDGTDIKKFYYEKKPNHYFQYYDENQNFYVNKKNDASDFCAFHNGVEPIYVEMENVSDNTKCIKAQIVDPNRNLEDELKRLKDKYFLEYEISLSDPRLLEIQRNTVSKGLALEVVASYYNIPIEETIAFGDGGNDIPMIKKAGLGIAMENATNDVKEVSQFVTLSNKESGVAYALKKYILNEKNGK